MTEERLILAKQDGLGKDEKADGETSDSKRQGIKKARFDATPLDLQPSAHSLGLHYEQPTHHAIGAPATQLLYGSSNEDVTASMIGVYNSAPFKVKSFAEKAPTAPTDIIQYYELQEEQFAPYGCSVFMQWRGQEPGSMAPQFVKILADTLASTNFPTDMPAKEAIAALRSLPKAWVLQLANKGKLITKVSPKGEITSLPFMLTYASTERNPHDSS